MKIFRHIIILRIVAVICILFSNNLFAETTNSLKEADYLELCNIYKGQSLDDGNTEYYNSDKNIIRITVQFDLEDIQERIFDVPLLSMGIFNSSST